MLNREYSTEEKEEEVLLFINNFIIQNGFAPTIREIGKSLGIQSTSTTHSYVERLKENGSISNLHDSPRTISVNTERYKNTKNKKVIKVNCETGTIPIIFQLGKESIKILNRYCTDHEVNENEAIQKALRALLIIEYSKEGRNKENNT